MHSTGTGQPVETQDIFFWRLAGRSAPTGLAIVHWIGCINAIKLAFTHTDVKLLLFMHYSAWLVKLPQASITQVSLAIPELPR